jgi:formamidopyrimidine-DNA glycosylase
VAGIGNIYADEALWSARLHPLRRTTSLRPADERRLYLAIREILAEAIERRGSSIDDYTAPDGDGEMQERLLVYQRTARTAPAAGDRCGGSSSVDGPPISARGASGCPPSTDRERRPSCGPPTGARAGPADAGRR